MQDETQLNRYHFGLKMVISRENGAFSPEIGHFHQNRFWGKKGLRGDSGAEKVWFSLGFTRGWRGVTRKRGNQWKHEFTWKRIIPVFQ